MAMELNDLYGAVLVLILIAMLVAVGLITLDKFGQTSGLSSNTSTAINDSITAIKAIASTWMALLVTIIVLAIILGLIIRSFVIQGR